MKKFTATAAQGEVNVTRLGTVPEGLTTLSPEDGVYVIGHSESGNAHVINAAGVTVMERTRDVPAGMRMLYAIVENPTALRQDASHPHDALALEPGIYGFRISREYNPFTEQARRVAD